MVPAGFSRANSQGLRRLRTGRLRIGVRYFTTSRHRPPEATLSLADPESAREAAQNAPFGSFEDQI
eukprot:14036153-Alexandrium_andersonii.AAC.1